MVRRERESQMKFGSINDPEKVIWTFPKGLREADLFGRCSTTCTGAISKQAGEYWLGSEKDALPEKNCY